MKNVNFLAESIAKQLQIELIDKDFLKIVEQEVEKLPDIEKTIIDRRFGEKQTLASLSEEMGKTVAEIVEIEDKAFKKIKANVKKSIK